MAAGLLFLRPLLVVVGRHWSSFDGPLTAPTAQQRPRLAEQAALA